MDRRAPNMLAAKVFVEILPPDRGLNDIPGCRKIRPASIMNDDGC